MKALYLVFDVRYVAEVVFVLVGLAVREAEVALIHHSSESGQHGLEGVDTERARPELWSGLHRVQSSLWKRRRHG